MVSDDFVFFDSRLSLLDASKKGSSEDGEGAGDADVTTNEIFEAG